MAIFSMFCCHLAQAQIAPGPLSRAHADLEGITRCGSCHGFIRTRLKCLECHKEIKRRVEAGVGYHMRVYKNSAGELDCARCHAEHRGSGYAFVPLDRKSFDHSAATGFVLEGKHSELECQNCHTASKIAEAARSEIILKDLSRSFLGLNRECSSCHVEPHQKLLGYNCVGCHTLESWKPASRFSHSRTAYMLTGLHQQVPCGQCHGAVRVSSAKAQNATAEGSSNPKTLFFSGLPFGNCQDCHLDPHGGAFENVMRGSSCEKCHDTGGWKSNDPGRNFDHNLTSFQRVGKHAELACGACHKKGDFRRPIPHDQCRSCHEDPHAGQFASRAAGSDCSACHSQMKFKPSLFDRKAHMGGSFPLAGKHAALGCAKCHQSVGRGLRYKTGKLLCSECHADPHGGEFALEPYGNKCDMCHTQEGFNVTTFTVARHAETRFPLAGRHAEVACRKCHKLIPAASRTTPEMEEASLLVASLELVGRSPIPNTRLQFRFASRGCSVCHNDPHGNDSQTHLSCEICHTPQQWSVLLPFDHSQTGFKFVGAHQEIASRSPCIKCHISSVGSEDPNVRPIPMFSNTSAQCSACHSEKDVHGGQFNNPPDRRKDCSYCHVQAAWNAGGFDHDTVRFVPSEAHGKVTCAKCHKRMEEANGKSVRIYRDTPADCLDCH